MTKRRVAGARSVLLAVAAVAFAALVCLPAARAQDRSKLVNVPTVVIGVSVSIWPEIVAQEKGFFADEGLDVDVIESGSSSRSVQQVAAGSAVIGSSSMVDTVRAIGAGATVKVFLNSLAVGTHSLIAAKSIKSVADLKGKRVMTGGPGDITNLWWYAMAKHFGLDPAADVDLLFSGSTTARLSALYAGGIEASVISTPQSFKAIEDGFTDLGPVAPYLGEFPMMIWQVNARWARANEKVLLAFTRAHNRAVRYMLAPAHKAEVAQFLAKAARSNLDDALRTWDLCVKIKAYVPDGSIADSTVERVRDTLLASGDLKPPPQPPAAYYDDRYVKAVAAANGGTKN